MGIRIALALPALLLTAAAPPKLDPDTRAWWSTTAELSNDAMEGRDTGSAAYDRAARLVARKFAAAGLKPAGENGGWFQRVPMHEIAVTSAQISVGGRPLRFLHDLTVGVGPGMPPRVSAEIVYAGYCGRAVLANARGKIVICHGTHREGLPDAAEREAAVRAAGAVGIMTIADPGFTVEPPRWPFAYARSVTLAYDPARPDPFLKLTLNAGSLAKIVGGKASNLIADGSAGKALPTFPISALFRAQFTTRERNIASSNVLAMLPGSDPAVANQAIALTAHLDGYGYGTPVNGDRLYNGTLDDAAYVALLIRLAERRKAQPFRRPVLFVVVTGEEKGLLGSRWFVKHPTVRMSGIAADINLDQLRPIFPLEILTVHALDDSTLAPMYARWPAAWTSRCNTIPSQSATCYAGRTTGRLCRRASPGHRFRLRLPSGVAERADLPAMVSHRLSQAAGRSEAADGLEGRGGLQSLLLHAGR